MDGSFASTRRARSGASVLSLVALVLLSCSCRVRRPIPAHELSDRWVEVDTEHVHLETDIGEAHGEEVAWAIEDLYLALLRVFPRCTLDRVPPIEATIFARTADYHEVAPEHSSGMLITPHAELVHLSARLVMPYEQRGRFAQVLAHELTHRILSVCMPAAPVWLHEGMATYFETIRVHDDRVVVGTPPFHFNVLGGGGSYVANGIVVQEIGRRDVPSVAELLSLDPTAFYAQDGGRVNYAAAWVLVHYLMLGPDHALRDRFTAYLAQLSGPVAATDLFVYAFAETGLTEFVAEYVAQRRRMARTVPYLPSPIHPTVVPMPSPTVHTRWAELLVRAEEGYEDARAHLEWADDLRSLLLRATMLEGDERVALIDAAMIRAPDDLDVLYARARIAIGAPDTEAASQVIEAMTARDDLRPWDRVALGQLFVARGQSTDALAQASQALAGERSWEGLTLMGASLIGLDRHAEAIPYLEMALVLTAEGARPDRVARIEALLAAARTAPAVTVPAAAAAAPTAVPAAAPVSD